MLTSTGASAAGTVGSHAIVPSNAVGSLGLAPGANFGDDVVLFEAAHGTAPDIAGRSLANPLGLILSAAMLLDYLGDDENANLYTPFIGHLIGLDYSTSPHLKGILGDAQQIRNLAFHYMTQFFTEITQEQTGVIFLEDIHWADRGSLDFFDHLMNTKPALPLLIIALTRSTLFEQRPDWGTGPIQNLRLDLLPLSEENSRRLVKEILQMVPEIPPAFIDLIVTKAEGSPYYIEELIKVLIEDGVIVKGEDIWQIIPHRLTQLRVPATLTGVLQARLDRLPATESDVLERAAVIGRTFWDAAVEAMRGSESAQALAGGEDVHAVLSALRNKELVFPHLPSTFDTVQEFIFKHAILREVTYERVLKAKRKLYHRMAAEWLIQQSGERVDEYLGLIAQHYELAGDTARAVEFLERAADQSMRLSAYREALAASERALAILASSNDSDPVVRARLLLTIGSAHLALTDHATAIARFEGCIALAHTIHDRGLEAKALARLGRIGLEQSKFDQSERHLRESLAIAHQLGLLDGWTAYYFGNMEEWCDGIAPNVFVEVDPRVRPDYVVIGEPTRMQVYRGHKGRVELKVEGLAPTERYDHRVFARLVSSDGEIPANMDLTIADPANLEDAIAVGAVHKERPHTYGVSYFSSRGPTLTQPTVSPLR